MSLQSLGLPIDPDAFPLMTESEGELVKDPQTVMDDIANTYTAGNKPGSIDHIDDIAPGDNTLGTLSTVYGTDSVDPHNLIQVPELTNENRNADGYEPNAMELIARMADSQKKHLNTKSISPEILTTGSLLIQPGTPAILVLGSDWTRSRCKFSLLASIIAVPTDVFGALAVTDTASHASAPFNVDNLANKSVLVKNTFDQAGNLTLQWAPTQALGATPLAAAFTTVSGAIAIAAGATATITPTSQGSFGQAGGWYRILYTATVAPTVGVINAWVSGNLINPVDKLYYGRSQAEANQYNGFPIYQDLTILGNDDMFVGPGTANTDNVALYWSVERYGEAQ